MIRWVPGHVGVLAYFTNFVLIGCFFGMGLGLMLARSRHDLSPFLAGGVTLLVALAVAFKGLWVTGDSEVLLFLEYEGPARKALALGPVLLAFYAGIALAGDKVTYDKHDIAVGVFPYNVAVTPNGLLALTANNGNGGTSDGNVDTVSVIDLQDNPPRVIDHVTVGDSTEGLVISPKGNLAVSIEARGSNYPKGTWFHHPTGAITVLKIDGKNVMPLGDMLVGVFPEGAVFSADGSHLYVGNFISEDLSVLKVDGTTLTHAGSFKLPGHPASMRGGPQ